MLEVEKLDDEEGEGQIVRHPKSNKSSWLG